MIELSGPDCGAIGDALSWFGAWKKLGSLRDELRGRGSDLEIVVARLRVGAWEQVEEALREVK